MNSEPSVEEILASIKKVIDRENRESAQAERRRRESDGIVREIAQEMAAHTPLAEIDEPAIALNEDTGAEADGDAEVLELGDAATAMLDDFEEPDEQAGDAPEGARSNDGGVHASVDRVANSPAAEPAAKREDEPGLIADAKAEAMRQSFAVLASLAAGAEANGESRISIDDAVREMLRPMLAQWLDDNLPEMVERLVKSEIARIAGIKS